MRFKVWDLGFQVYTLNTLGACGVDRTAGPGVGSSFESLLRVSLLKKTCAQLTAACQV